jgi:hypothetical protein
MTWQCKLPLYLAALALLTGCVPPVPLPPPAAPRTLAQPVLSAADIREAEQNAYWSGFAAGRRCQKQQDAQTAADAPATPPAAPSVAPPATPLVQPDPPFAPLPTDGYAPKGPAQPVATPLD